MPGMVKRRGNSIGVSQSSSSIEPIHNKALVYELNRPDRKCWYAVRCKCRQEHVVLSNLNRAGIVTFCPQIKESRIAKFKLQTSIGPLFPGYLFAKFDMRHDYRTVKYARGVHGVVSFGMSPAVVDEELIQAIQKRLDGGYVMVNDTFIEGQTVKIQNDLMHGMEAIFSRRIPGYQRAVLLLRAISFHAKLVVDLQDIVNL
jgi:transcriptional antiterminator RfaH